MEQPLVSVIIPAYNAVDYIEETLESVFNQSYANFEVVVVNNGSTDSTLELLNSLDDKRLRVISQEGTGSPAGPRNTGIKESSGDLIAFVDADDCWMRDKLAKQVAFLTDHPETGLVATRFYHVDKDSKRISSSAIPERWPDQRDGRWFEALCKGNFIANSTVMIRRGVLEEVGLLNEEKVYRGTEDYEMWLRVAKNYPIALLEEPLMNYRIHGGAASGHFWLDMARGAFLAVAGNVSDRKARRDETSFSDDQKELVAHHFQNWALEVSLRRNSQIDESHEEDLRVWAQKLGLDNWLKRLSTVSWFFPNFVQRHINKYPAGKMRSLLGRLLIVR